MVHHEESNVWTKLSNVFGIFCNFQNKVGGLWNHFQKQTKKYNRNELNDVNPKEVKSWPMNLAQPLNL